MCNAIIVGLALAVCAPALAQAQAAPPDVPARYSFNRVDDGFLRLDTTTGQVSICSQRAVGWACQALPEDRAALEREIARLQAQITGLKTEIAGLREPPPPRPPAELTPPGGKDDSAGLQMPSREDIERARAAMERAWRRLVDMLVNFQKDLMGKG